MEFLPHREHISIKEMSWLMLCGDAVSVYNEKWTKPVYTLLTQNVGCAGVYNDICALKSWMLHKCKEEDFM
jgi:hypothetical protein